MRRSLAPVLVSIVVAFVPAGHAGAGGSWLYPDRQVYEPGDLARIHGSFGSGSLEGTIADGPYVAYLLPQNAWIQRGTVPEQAIRLGDLGVVRGGPYGMRASLTFTVPEVPTGWYHVGYCNDPCTVDGIGDLIGSQGFVVAPTRREGRYIFEISRLEARVDSVRRQVVARTRGERKRLERTIAARSAELVDARARIAELETSLGRLRAGRSERPIVPGWAVWVLGAATVTAALVIGRRRSWAPPVPDTIPDDLLDADPALERSTRGPAAGR